MLLLVGVVAVRTGRPHAAQCVMATRAPTGTTVTALVMLTARMYGRALMRRCARQDI